MEIQRTTLKNYCEKSWNFWVINNHTKRSYFFSDFAHHSEY